MTALTLLFVLLAFALRMVNLGHLGLWGDEAWGLYLNRLGLWGLTLETAPDMHPPVYHYLLYLWVQVAGSGEWAVRYLSVCAGTLLTAATYALGRRLAGRRVGGLAALLMAWAPFAVHYSQEARPYILALLWCTLAAYVLLRVVERPTRRAWGAYALLTFLAGFTLYSTALWFGTHGLLLLARPAWRRRFVSWLGVELAVVLLAVAPWLAFFGRAITAEIKVQGDFTLSAPLSLPELSGRMVSGFLAGLTLPGGTALALSGLLLLVAAAGWLAARRRNGPAVALAMALAFLPVLELYPIHLYLPWFEPRVLVFCAAPCYVLLAMGLDGCWSRGGRALAAAGLLVSAAWGVGLYDYYIRFDRYSPRLEDYRPLIAQVQQYATPGDVVLYKARWNVGYFEAYYQGPPLDFRQLLPASVEPLAGGPRQVWVMARDIVRRPGGATPEDQAEDWLSARAYKASETWFGAIRLARYLIPPQAEAPAHPVNVQFERGLTLRAFSLQPDLENDVLLLKPGQAVYLDLAWQAGQSLDLAYNVFSHIIGPYNPATNNPVWGQHDGVPANQERPPTTWAVDEIIHDRHVLWLDAAAPPGDYWLEVGVYDPGNGARLNVTQPDGTHTDHAILAPVRISAP